MPILLGGNFPIGGLQQNCNSFCYVFANKIYYNFSSYAVNNYYKISYRLNKIQTEYGIIQAELKQNMLQFYQNYNLSFFT